MIRVLHVLGGLGTGGTESLIMNWYRNIDRDKIQFDFLVRSSDDNYINEIKELGGRVFYTSSFPRHFIKNYRETCEILKRKEWDVIHVHGNAAMYILPLQLAKKLGYKCRVMHSHSVKAQNRVFSIVHYLNRKRLPKYSTVFFACSESAGKWMFNQKQYLIVRNAIDSVNFQYSSVNRAKVRTAYGLEEKFVVGHVGRFVTLKNHGFLLNVFHSFLEYKPNSMLMLIGDGELEETIKEKAAQMGISESILFMGRRSDVGELMSAMDMFVLPSFYEGLGIVLVEAQINGLPCVVSEEAFVSEVQITPSLSKIALKDGAEVWAKHMQEVSCQKNDRHIDNIVIRNSGYDMKTEIVRLEAIYLQATKGNVN